MIINQSSVHYTTQCLMTRVWRDTEGSGHIDQSGLFGMVRWLRGPQFVGWDASCCIHMKGFEMVNRNSVITTVDVDGEVFYQSF